MISRFRRHSTLREKNEEEDEVKAK